MKNLKYQLLQLIAEGKIEGQSGMDRKQISWLRNIRGEVIHTAMDKERYEHLVANTQ